MHFFAPAPILPGPKKQKVHERAQSLTETLATQAMFYSKSSAYAQEACKQIDGSI